MSLIKTNKCRFCNSKNIRKIKIDNSTKNFYVKAIISDLNLKIVLVMAGNIIGL